MRHPLAPLRVFPPLLREGGRSQWPGEAGSTAALDDEPSAFRSDLGFAPSPLWGEGRGEGPPPPTPVVNFTQPFIERALKERVRYRYVQPSVLRDGEGFRIEAPCCSRNVNAEGGVIDIARLTPAPDGSWALQARDHAAGQWIAYANGMSLGEALDTVCIDAERKFWP